jgi:hypothetical protein
MPLNVTLYDNRLPLVVSMTGNLGGHLNVGVETRESCRDMDTLTWRVLSRQSIWSVVLPRPDRPLDFREPLTSMMNGRLMEVAQIFYDIFALL